MVTAEETPTYQQLLDETAKNLGESGTYTTELSGPQTTGLIRSVVEDAASAQLPGFVSTNIQRLSVVIEEDKAQVDAAIEAGVGPFRRAVEGKIVLENTPDQQGLQASEITTNPSSLHIPSAAHGIVNGLAKKAARMVTGEEVDVPHDIDIQGSLKRALNGDNTTKYAVVALNSQLRKRGVEATQMQMAITKEQRLQLRIQGRRTPAA